MAHKGKAKYDALLEAYKKANPSMQKKTQYENAQKLWNELKTDQEALEKKMFELKTKASKLESKKLEWWTKLGKSAPSTSSSAPSTSSSFDSAKFEKKVS